MLRNAVYRRTARNPPAPSGGKWIGACTAPRTLASESPVDALPFGEVEGLRAPLRAYPGLAKPCGSLCTSKPIHPSQRPGELLPALLEHRFDKPQERIEVVDAHGGLRPHLHHDEGGVDLGLRPEGRRG